jgi:hypothetical protein
LMNSATMRSISLTSTSFLLELLAIESPLITYWSILPHTVKLHTLVKKLLGSELS